MTATGEPTPWQDDAFERKGYAEFLTQHLVAQTHLSQDILRPYCLALDADWGAGKSYFVKNWRMQLAQETKYPSFLFDAWAADYQADPFIAFMASFNEAIEAAIGELPTTTAIKTKAKNKLGKSVKTMRQALLPVSKAVFKGAVEKIVPGAWEEIRAFASGNKGELSEIDFESMKGDAIEGVRAGLETYFKESLKEQVIKQRLIEEFRGEIKETLEILTVEGGSTLPFFVFIDEIDRCRPSFAIALLEQLKHIFNIPGVCFVISTNLQQLAHAVRGVYGSGFNGRTYLQRFFDSECALPVLSPRSYIETIIRTYPALQDGRISLGFPHSGFLDPLVKQPSLADMFTWVIESFELDLRSQKRLVSMVNASLGSLQNHTAIFAMWLAILSAAKIKSDKLFDLLAHADVDRSTLKQVWREVVQGDSARKCRVPSRRAESPFGFEEHDVFLHEVADWYYTAAHDSLRDLMDRINKSSANIYDYSYRIWGEIQDHSGDHIVLGGRQSRRARTAISGYSQLVTYAGHFSG